MKKFVCQICGYVHEGDSAPEFCPQCKAPASKFTEVVENEKVWAAEHVVGVAKGVDPEIIEGLKMNFNGECTEVGMYLAMARVAHREGYPEIGLYWEKAAYEEAEHAAKFAELLGEVVTDSTKKNLEMRVEAENGAREKGKGTGAGCHPRHRARNGARRSASRQSLRGTAEEILQQIKYSYTETKRGMRRDGSMPRFIV